MNLKVDLRVDEQYIPDMNQRLTVYRKVAGARTEQQLEQTLADLRDDMDRFRIGTGPGGLR